MTSGPVSDTDLLTAEQSAEILGLQVVLVIRRMHDGRLPWLRACRRADVERLKKIEDETTASLLAIGQDDAVDWTLDAARRAFPVAARTRQGPVIVRQPGVLGGEPTFRGTRLPAGILFENLAEGYTIDEIVENFPTLDREEARLALMQACEALALRAPICGDAPEAPLADDEMARREADARRILIDEIVRRNPAILMWWSATDLARLPTWHLIEILAEIASVVTITVGSTISILVVGEEGGR